MTGDSSTSLLFLFFLLNLSNVGKIPGGSGCSSGEGSGPGFVWKEVNYPQKTLLCVQICIVVNQLETNIYKHID